MYTYECTDMFPEPMPNDVIINHDFFFIYISLDTYIIFHNSFPTNFTLNPLSLKIKILRGTFTNNIIHDNKSLCAVFQCIIVYHCIREDYAQSGGLRQTGVLY